MDHSITTHNGEITMQNPETGNHRTIRIRTQPQDARFAPGSRIVYLLNGHDNERDYLPFAFLNDRGQVIVWRRYRNAGSPTAFEQLARMIEDPARFEARGIVYLFATTCRRCNRKLTTPQSIERGIGPVCEGRE